MTVQKFQLETEHQEWQCKVLWENQLTNHIQLFKKTFISNSLVTGRKVLCVFLIYKGSMYSRISFLICSQSEVNAQCSCSMEEGRKLYQGEREDQKNSWLLHGVKFLQRLRWEWPCGDSGSLSSLAARADCHWSILSCSTSGHGGLLAKSAAESGLLFNSGALDCSSFTPAPRQWTLQAVLAFAGLHQFGFFCFCQAIFFK